MPTNQQAFENAKRKIEQARKDGATELDLSCNWSSEDSERLTALPESLGQLTQLQTLELTHNQLTSLPESLANLTQLQTLELTYNQLTSLPDSLANLTQLRDLDVASNQLTVLPESLGQITQLSRLNLPGNQLRALPESIGELRELHILNLDGNRLTSLPKSFERLTSLRFLSLLRNPFGCVPIEIRPLARSLVSLDLGGIGLTSIPKWLGEFIQLETLFLDTGLNRTLNLDWVPNGSSVPPTTWSDLPSTLADLDRLQFLYIESSECAPELLAAYRIGVDAVKAYLRAKAEDQIVLNEAKLILIGEGEVGKSCLLDALRNEPWQEHDSTHGIRLAQVEITDKDTGTVMTLNGWDFGGQRVYRPTHQLFFSSPAVYLVVWKPREGQQAGQVKEWIKLVKHREPDAKILVVATHGGPKDRQPDIDRYEITNQFNKDSETVVDFHWIDSRPTGYVKEDKSTWTGERTGISELRDAIAKVAVELPEVGREVPGKWQRLWEELENSERSWMSWDDFRRFCVEGEGTTIAEDQFELFAKLSHTLGHLIHYDYDTALRNIVILKPDWLATAISFVLDDGETRKNQGLVTLGRLNQLWDNPDRDAEERYPIELHSAFVRLMDRFDLSYEVELPEKDVSETDRTILVSQLVPDTRPASFPDWNEEPADGDSQRVQICRIVDEQGQSAVAEGLFYQLIVRLHKYSLGRNDYRASVHWQRGLMLDDDYNGRALLEHIGNDVHITVRAAFPEWFLSVLTREVKWLVESFWEGLRCEVTVPCVDPCGKDKPGTGLFEVQKLVAFQRQGMQQFPCMVSGCNQAQDIHCLLRNSPATHSRNDIVNATISDLSDQLADVRETMLCEFAEADRHGLNRFEAIINSTKRLETGQKRIMSMIDEQFDGLMRALVDEAKEGPRLFSFEPIEKSDRDSFLKRLRKTGQQEYRLTLWCEHARLPLTAINDEGDDSGVYTLSIPNKWVVNGASFLSKLNTVLGLVLPVAGAGLKVMIPDDVYKEISNTLDFKRQVAASLVKAGDTIGSLMSSGKDDFGSGLRGDDSGRIRAEGSTLQELHSFLNAEDKKKEKRFGGLVRVQNKQREYLWVHERFVDEY